MSQFTEIVEMLIEFFTPYSGCGGKPHRLSPPPHSSRSRSRLSRRLNLAWWIEDARSQSYPVRPDAGAGRQALRDRLEDQLRFRGDAIKPAKSEAIDDLLATALSGDKPAVAQTCRVGADPRLRLADGRHQLAHGEVAFVKELEDVQPSRVPQDSEETRCGGSVGWRHKSGIHIWKAGYHMPSFEVPTHLPRRNQLATRDTTPGHVETSVERVSQAIKGAMPVLDETDRQIATALYRLMSLGKPVEPAAIGEAVGIDVDYVEARLVSWPGVFRDQGGRVAGFWGHAIAKLDPEYRLIADGQTTYAWCALDTLFIPGIIGKTVRVEASDPISGQPISILVDRDGARGVSPAGALVSVVVPDGPFGYDVIESFCHRVLFFASEDTGTKWIAEHPDTTLLSVADAFEVGRALTTRIIPGVGQ